MLSGRSTLPWRRFANRHVLALGDPIGERLGGDSHGFIVVAALKRGPHLAEQAARVAIWNIWFQSVAHLEAAEPVIHYQ